MAFVTDKWLTGVKINGVEINTTYHARYERYRRYYYDTSRTVNYIVEHYTAHVAPAKNFAIAAQNNVDQSSFHFVVDTNSIYQIVPLCCGTYSVGDGSGGSYGAVANNSNNISIEMVCTSDWEIPQATQKLAAALTAYLMKKYNIGINNVIRHYDVSKKLCPRTMTDATATYRANWANFKAKVQAAYGGTTSTPPATSTTVNYKAVTTADLNCRKGASTSYSIIKTYRQGTILTITKESNGWGYTGEGWVCLDYVSKVQDTQQTFKPYLVKITASVLNVRSGPGIGYNINTTVSRGGVYTIVEEKNGWGKLKSGAGWISLAYTNKV